ncbi:MAG: hypothetical protein ACI4VF_05570 [Lachnospirales bacterium]
MKGRLFLLISGIIMIIMGAISLISSAVSLPMVFGFDIIFDNYRYILMDATLQTPQMEPIINFMLKFLTFEAMLYGVIFSLVMAVTNIVAGIFGVRFNNRKDKANVCLGLGILNIVVIFLGFVIYAVITSPIILPFVIIYLVLPILYVIGAAKNKCQKI